MKVGIKSVSMDDIARSLGISKKTIYKHFSDKRDLVSKVIELNITKEQGVCNSHFGTPENAIRKMIDLSKYVSQTHKSMNATVLYDLQKYYPSQWKKFEAFRVGFISESIKTNIEDGIQEGLFRKTIEPAILSRLYVLLVQGLMKLLSEHPGEYDFVSVHQQMVSYHLYGICSPKGLIYLEQHINEI